MTTTNEAKPYTNEDIKNLRRSLNDARNNPPTPRVVRRLLATLDERDRQLAEAMPPRALREWREALGEHAPEDTGGWSPLVAATRVVVRDLDDLLAALDEVEREAASLRAEVARLRDSERKAWESCRETCVNLAAAERRAEEAEGRLRALASLLHQILEPEETYDPDMRLTVRATITGKQRRAIRDTLATHPPQQQTPAPSDERQRDPLRSIRDLIANTPAAPGPEDVGILDSVLVAIDAIAVRALAALPSQEQPSAHAPNPPLQGGCACTPAEQCAWHQMFGRFFAAPSTPEGQPADDDADRRASTEERRG